MAEYRAQAEATLAKKSVFAMFTGSTQKYEDAAELFTKAGTTSTSITIIILSSCLFTINNDHYHYTHITTTYYY